MNKTWLAVLVGAVLIAGAGFGVNQIFAGESDPALTTQEAVQKAEERYPGRVKEVELYDNGSGPVYEIELEGPGGNYEIKMDANTGEILKVEQGERSAEEMTDADENEDQDTPKPAESTANKPDQPNGNERISFEEAQEIARNQFDGKIIEIELDEDDGRWIYEVELQKGKQEAELEIDAYTGEILFMSVENDD